MLSKSLAALGLALALSAFGAGAAKAQEPTTGADMTSDLSQSDALDAMAAPSRNVTPSRLPNERRAQQRFNEVAEAQRRGGNRGPDYTGLAQAAVNASGIQCAVTEAANPGVTPQQESIYEVACATGPGYIVVASRTPRSFDCLEVAGRAAETRALYVEADVGQQCQLPANQNGLALIGGWAREAGVTCPIDEAIDVGKNARGNVVYEIGCADADGYWLEKAGDTWNLQECLEVITAGEICRFTTPLEQARSFKPRLAGTAAAGCDVAQVRLIGMNPAGERYFEAKCAMANEGYIVRLDDEGTAQQVYPCASAPRIGGGCTLTRVPTS